MEKYYNAGNSLIIPIDDKHKLIILNGKNAKKISDLLINNGSLVSLKTLLPVQIKFKYNKRFSTEIESYEMENNYYEHFREIMFPRPNNLINEYLDILEYSKKYLLQYNQTIGIQNIQFLKRIESENLINEIIKNSNILYLLGILHEFGHFHDKRSFNDEPCFMKPTLSKIEMIDISRHFLDEDRARQNAIIYAQKLGIKINLDEIQNFIFADLITYFPHPIALRKYYENGGKNRLFVL